MEHFWFLPMIFILGVTGHLADMILIRFRIRRYGWAVITIAMTLLYVIIYPAYITDWFSLKDIVAFGWTFAFGALCACFNTLDLIGDKYKLSTSAVCLILSVTIYIWNLLFFCGLR